jgi:hypothetical protein
MTAAGADGVLAKLLAAGLIVRRPGRAGGFCVAAVAGDGVGSSANPIFDARVASSVDDLDAAIADLDRLLAGPAV